MPTLTAKVTESITLDSGTVDSTHTLTIGSIADVTKRIVTVAVAETGLIAFSTIGTTDLSKSYVAGKEGRKAEAVKLLKEYIKL